MGFLCHIYIYVISHIDLDFSNWSPEIIGILFFPPLTFCVFTPTMSIQEIHKFWIKKQHKKGLI